MIPQSLRENKPKILRRLTFFGIFSAVALVQNIGLLPEIVGLRFLPLLPLTVAVSRFERETYGLNFGLLAGVLCDLNIGRADGAHALFFALMGFVCGLLMTYLMMNNLITASLLAAVWELLYALFGYVLHCGFSGGSLRELFGFYLPSALLNLLTMPLIYYLVRAVNKQFRLMENEEI
ncbi:MAG TPA: hypothetical protein DDY98_08580 [Ruminococcaceae bacterium]|nr:hypothetical protein [Oscillospiraceae bacterium]